MGHRSHHRWFICALLVPLLGAQPLVQSTNLNQQLVTAAEEGDVAAAADLLAKGVDVDGDNGYGITPIHAAADWANLELVKLLLEHGADPNTKLVARAKSPWGKTPLKIAANPNGPVRSREARAEIIKLLVEKGGGTEGEALVDLIREGYFEAVPTILSRGGVNPSYLNSALGAATRAQQTELAELLVKAGAKEPGPADSARSPERLKLVMGVYRSQPGEELTLGPGIEDEELLLERAARAPVALVPADLRLLRSRDRTLYVLLNTGPPPPTELTLHDGGRSEVFTRTAEVTTRTRTTRIERRTVPTVSPPPSIATAPGAREWSSFRGGPSSSGILDGAHPPTEWDVEQSINVQWKTLIPGFGHSSPIIWGDRVFVTTAVPMIDTTLTFHFGGALQSVGALAHTRDEVPHSWRVYALDKQSGKILWERVAHEAVPRTARHVMASQANQTPATDGTHVVAWFGSDGLYCYTVDGTLLWKKDLGRLQSGRYFEPGYEWNTASSPVIYKNLVILQVDLIEENSYIVALDITTGTEVWRTERDEFPSWPTPLIYEGASRTELITQAIKFARGYDPDTGEELWRLGQHGDFPSPTPIAGRGLIFLTSAYGTIQPIYAIRPGANGDITLADDEASNDYVVWSKRRGGSVLPTPILYGDLLYVCSGSGILAVYEADTGERVYRARVTQGINYTASPVAADGKLYFANEDGEVIVVKAGRQFERLAVNPMGEVIMATPAISEGMILIRTQHHVVAVAESAPNESGTR